MQYPYVITKVEGNVITAFNKDTGRTITRNISFFKAIPVTAKAPRARIVIEGGEGEQRSSQVPQQTTQQPRETQQPKEAKQTIP